VIGYGSQGRAHALNLRDSGEEDAEQPIEKVGRELRSMMTWLEPVEK
jgi:ketol-acid reductoisomerase